MIKIRIKKLCPDARIPVRVTPYSAGYDLFSVEEKILNPGEYAVVSCGIAIELPNDVEAQVRPRSGLAAKYGIGLLNSPGTIDPDYRGEIKVILFNFGKEKFKIEKGMRIAQIVFSKVLEVSFEEGEIGKTERGEGGFGSTGIK